MSLSPRRLFYLCLVIITLLAGIIRLHRLAEFPQRFDSDEMISGYESWSLWRTGADQHGTVLPLHARGYNDYVLALPYYIAAPVVGLLGLNEFSARLPYALLGIATVFLTGVQGRRWFGSVAGLIAALLLTIDPWHVSYSRMAYPLDCVPFFTVLALLVFTEFMEVLASPSSTQIQKQRWTIGSAACFALLVMTYSTMLLQASLLVAACAVAAWPILGRNRSLSLVWFALFIILSSPLLVDQALHWSLFDTHLAQVSVTRTAEPVINFFRNYAAQYDPKALFFDGLNRSLEPDVVYGIGELFWLEGPLWLVALAGLIRRDIEPFDVPVNLPVLLGGWFFVYPLAASLTYGPTSHREINFLPLPELLAAYGAVVLVQWLSRTRLGRPGAWTLVGATGLSLLAVFSTRYLNSYFTTPLLQSEKPVALPFNIGLRPALSYLTSAAQPCDEIWLEPSFQVYMAYLFYTDYPAERFQHTPIYKTTDDQGWLQVQWFDNVRVGIPGTPFAVSPPARPECQAAGGRPWFVARNGHLDGPAWHDAYQSKNAQGDTVWRVQVYDPAGS